LRHYAAESLGRIGSSDSVELLTTLLSDGDAVLRAYATRALGFYPSETSLDYLNEALLDSFWRVRVAALQGIAEQGASGAVGAVAYKARRDPERPVREEAVKTLGAIGGREATTALSEVLIDERAAETLRMSAARELLSADARAHREAFEQVVTDEWSREGSRLLDTVAKGLGEAGEASFESFYLRFLDHPNFIIRIYGMRGIGNAGLSSRVEPLKEIARENPTGILRTSALTALQELGVDYDPESDDNDETVEEGESAE
jgi:HEAT repeat protein